MADAKSPPPGSSIESTLKKPDAPRELLVDVVFSEGGFSLLIVFPLVVVFFFTMATATM